MNVRKAVIPVAGKGTRFLPASKELPKEMIPILNLPMIHYVVEEAVHSGIDQIIFVTSSGKESVENYFDRNFGLENFLAANGKTKELEEIKRIASMVEIITVRQKEQKGLGHAILCASPLIGNENFAVLLGDDLVINEQPCTAQLMNLSAKNDNAPVIGVMEVPRNEVSKYGIISGKPSAGDERTYLLDKMIEKPDPDEAPSNLATPGRYILSPKIFDYLRAIPKGAGGEYQLTDAINLQCRDEKFLAYKFYGERFDAGSLNGHLNATIEFAARRPDLKGQLEESIRTVVKKYGIKL